MNLTPLPPVLSSASRSDALPGSTLAFATSVAPAGALILSVKLFLAE